MGRTFETRYSEHIQAIKVTKISSILAQHFLETGCVEDSVQILHRMGKGMGQNLVSRQKKKKCMEVDSKMTSFLGIK